MDTKVIKISPDSINESEKILLNEAAELLRRGELVAFPTETVYGLGGDAMQAEASKRIYSAKGRPSDNPLIVHVSDIEQVERIASEIPQAAMRLMEKFWPGPLTIVFNKREEVPYGTTGGLDTVAVRMPNHNVARELIRISGVLVAAPSANLSGRPSPTSAKHVYDDLNGRIPMIIDSGMVGIGIESTIVDVTGDEPVILRPGYITEDMIKEVVGSVSFDRAIIEPMAEGIRPKAPGMKYKHYAPKAELVLYEGNIENVISTINMLTFQNDKKGLRTGIIACDETEDRYNSENVLSIGTRQDELTIARNLYNVLRTFDDMNVDVIYGESFEDHNLGKAIMNRLRKAAGYKVEKV